MQIALYYPWIYLRSGVERTILELVKRSRHDWVIFTSHFEPDSTYPGFKDIKVIELGKVPVRRSYLYAIKAAITILLQKIDLREHDALWVHSEGLGDLITFRNHSKPVTCFCHTPLKVIHDPAARKAYLKKNKTKMPFFMFFSGLFRFIDRLAWRNYRHIFCVSQEVKERILRAGLAPLDKIEIIYRGVDTQNIQPRWNYETYFLHPTRIKWWKNLELSIESFKEFQNRFTDHNDFRLIIAGQVDEGSKAYYRKILNMCSQNVNIQIIPNPAEKELEGFYRNCYAVLNTTLNEDWGLVPLEAMAYGKPVIAVNRGGPKESILHGRTGLLVESSDVAFAEAMEALARDKDLVLRMGREARSHSFRYDWSNFIDRIDKYIDSLV